MDVSRYRHDSKDFHENFGGDTSTTKEASKEAPTQYNLRRNAKIRSNLYQINNMMILTKKFNNPSLEDVYISKDFEDM